MNDFSVSCTFYENIMINVQYIKYKILILS